MTQTAASPDTPSVAPRLASRIDGLRPSLVREILAAASQPDVISFAGGLPAPDLMPTPEPAILRDPALYQYGPSEGEPAFRRAVANWIGRSGLRVESSQILALAGSQQGLDLAAKLLIDPDSPVLVESPTYLAALQVFQLFAARLASVPLDDEGISLDRLEHALRTHRPRALYVVPTFQNPSGIRYSLERRRAVAELLDRHQVTLIEDDPYRHIDLGSGEASPPICGMLRRSHWIYLGSFSKILWPGMRIGYLAASPALLPHLLKLKQAGDLHTQRPGQMAIVEWLGRPGRDAELGRLVAGYRARRDAMQAALQRHLGDIARWKVPEGGLFFWLRLQRGRADRALLERALRSGVAFMPGAAFHLDHEACHDCLRLNYSHATPEAMDRGLGILSELLRT